MNYKFKQRCLSILIALILLIITPLSSGYAFKGNHTKIGIPLCNYLVITTKDLSKAVEPLVSHREQQGYFTKISFVSDIIKKTGGKNNCEKIHNFLKEHYKKWGVKYVLLVGWIDKIPMLYAYPDAKNHAESMNSPARTPTDYYYADLDSNWDSDGDGYPGEFSDDSEINFSPEVYVGRIPFDDPDIVRKVCSNIVNFDKESESFKRKVLYAGAMLIYNKESYDGSRIYKLDGAKSGELLKQMLKDKNFSLITMYEKEGLQPSIFNCNIPLNKTNFIQILEDGVGFAAIEAHGDKKGIYRKLWVKDNNKDSLPDDGFKWSNIISSMDNLKIRGGVFLSGSCLTSYPEDRHNLGATILREGGTGYIGSTRINWIPSYFSSPEDGGSGSIAYYIEENFLVKGESLGESLFNSLYFYHLNFQFNDIEDPIEAGQMNLFDFNLYGDPATTLFVANDKPYILIKKPVLRTNGKKNSSVDIYMSKGKAIPVIDSRNDFNAKIEKISCCSYKLKIPPFNFSKGVYKIYISVENEKLPLYILVTDKAPLPFHVSTSVSTNHLKLQVFADSNFSFKKYIYSDIIFNPDLLECQKYQWSDKLQSLIPNFVVVDNYEGELSFKIEAPSNNEIKFSAGELIISLQFRARYSFEKSAVYIRNSQFDSHKYEDKIKEIGKCIGIIGDVNKDGNVNSLDFDMIKNELGVNYMDTKFNELYDLNNDGIIDGKDLALVSIAEKNRGQLYTNFTTKGDPIVVLPSSYTPKSSRPFTITLYKNDDDSWNFLYGKMFYDPRYITLIGIKDHQGIVMKRRNGCVYFFKILNSNENDNEDSTPEVIFKFSPIRAGDTFIDLTELGAVSNSGKTYKSNRFLNFRISN